MSKWREATFQRLLEEGLLEIGDDYRAQNNVLGCIDPILIRAGHVTDSHVDFDCVEHFHKHIPNLPNVRCLEKFRPELMQIQKDWEAEFGLASN